MIANPQAVVTSIATKVLLNISNVASIAVNSNTTISTTSSSAGEVTEDIILVNASSSAITITLPSALNRNDLHYRIKKIDGTGNTVTVTTPLLSGQTIDGSATNIFINTIRIY